VQRILRWILVGALTAGCGDKCEQLCTNTAAELQACKPDSLSWQDLGARGRNDFVNQCRNQWGRQRLDLSATDLRLALQACQDTSQDLGSVSCEELLALYLPQD
jgi:hypothetical protein